MDQHRQRAWDQGELQAAVTETLVTIVHGDTKVLSRDIGMDFVQSSEAMAPRCLVRFTEWRLSFETARRHNIRSERFSSGVATVIRKPRSDAAALLPSALGEL